MKPCHKKKRLKQAALCLLLAKGYVELLAVWSVNSSSNHSVIASHILIKIRIYMTMHRYIILTTCTVCSRFVRCETLSGPWFVLNQTKLNHVPVHMWKSVW